MLTFWKKRTNRGRVVYDRAPHMFGSLDLFRIANSTVGSKSFRDASEAAGVFLTWWYLTAWLVAYGEAQAIEGIYKLAEEFPHPVLKLAGQIMGILISAVKLAGVDLTQGAFDYQFAILAKNNKELAKLIRKWRKDHGKDR